jgi:hypothetical protein
MVQDAVQIRSYDKNKDEWMICVRKIFNVEIIRDS